MDLLFRIGDVWVRRRARPHPMALLRVRGLVPATVITGASEGLGLELARVIARGGRAVVLIARTKETLEEAARSLREDFRDAKVIAAPLDVGDPGVPARIDELLEQNGLYLDVLVNNAGIGLGGRFSEMDPETLDELVQTNVAAVTRLCRHYLPAMRARCRGGIMNVASLAAFVPGPWHAPYFASKAYVLSLTAALAAECAGEGVRICAFAPGPIETGIHVKMDTTTTLYRFLLPSSSPQTTARLAWRSYRLACRVVVPGLINACLAWSGRALPFNIVVPIAAFLMKPRTEAMEWVGALREDTARTGRRVRFRMRTLADARRGLGTGRDCMSAVATRQGRQDSPAMGGPSRRPAIGCSR